MNRLLQHVVVPIRWWLYPLLPVLGLLAILAGTVCLLDRWLCVHECVSWCYNAVALWLVATYHSSECGFACTLFLVLALLTGWQRYCRIRYRGCLRWLVTVIYVLALAGTAGYFIILWPLSRFSLSLDMPASILLLSLGLVVSWALLLWPRGDWPTPWGGCLRGVWAGCAALFGGLMVCQFIVWPQSQLRPLLCLLPLLLLLWVWVRANWAYLLWRPKPLTARGGAFRRLLPAALSVGLLAGSGRLFWVWFEWQSLSAAVLALLLLWLGLRIGLPCLTWLGRGATGSVRGYWERSAGGAGYLRWLRRLRACQRGRPLEPAGRPCSGDDRNRQRAEGGNSWWETFFGCCASRLVVVPLARLAPAVPASLAAEDRLLASELEHLVALSWDAAERELYAVGNAIGDEIPPVDAETRGRLTKGLRGWRPLLDALIECHLFDVSLEDLRSAKGSDVEEDATEEGTAWSICSATNHLARASRVLILPTLRDEVRDAGDDSLPLFWWEGDLPRTLLSAEKLVAREIQALNLLLLREAKPEEQVNVAALAELCRESRGGRNRRQLAAMRLVFAHVVRWGLLLGSGARRRERRRFPVIPRELWSDLRRLMEQDVRPLLFSEATVSEQLREFALATRYRYFDACLLNPETQFRQLRSEVDACAEKWSTSDEAWRKLDQWYAGQTHLQESWWGGWSLDQRRHSCRSAIERLQHSRHRCLRTVRKVIDPDLREAMASVSEEVPREPEPPSEPVHTSQQLHGRWQGPSGRSRLPNVFVRARLGWAWLAVCLAAAVVVHWTAAGPIVRAPDLRLGNRHLHETVNAVVPGLEKDEPSVWVATAGGGVHVKAGGIHHHWSNWTARNTAFGLPSDDVLRLELVNRPQKMATYLCRQGEQKVVGVSDYPAAALGRWPTTCPKAWATLLGDSQFADVDDDQVTAVLQPRGCPLLLLGSQNAGLGRYHVAERRWLDRTGPPDSPRQVTINPANRFLGPRQGAIRDIAAARDDGTWIAWVATDDGIAGGPVWNESRSPGPQHKILPENWSRIPGDRLLDPRVVQVRVRLDQDTSVVDYRTQGEGLGTVRQDRVGAHSHLARVGQTSVEGLSEETLRRVVYSKPGKRIWTVDTPNSAAEFERISVYREGSHQWRAERPGQRPRHVFDLKLDPRRSDSVLVGTDNGLASVIDDTAPAGGSLQIQGHGPAQAAVRQVAVSADRAVAWVQKRGCSHPGVYALKRDKQGAFPSEADADWRTIVGPRRFDQRGLSLDQITTVEPTAGGRGLYFGTRQWGIGYIDRSTREVYPLLSERIRRNEGVLDLCELPDEAAAGRRLLFQVAGDCRIDCIDLEAQQQTTVLNGKKPKLGNDLLAAAVLGSRLFLGGSEGIAGYDMQRHRWWSLDPLPGLVKLAVSGGDDQRSSPAAERLWALTTAGSGTLHVLDADQTKWSEPRLEDVRAFDPAPQHLVAATHSGGLYVVEPEGDNLAILEPTPIESPGLPTTAAVGSAQNANDLYVAMGNSVARFRMDDHHWKSFPRSGRRDLDRIFANRDGLWLLDDSGQLYLGADAEEPVASHVKIVEWDEQDVIALQSHGGVVRLSGQEQDVVVGAAFDADVTRQTTAVRSYRNDLFVAVGNELGQYQFRTHSWKTVTPPDAASLKQLVTTDSQLFALDSAGQLFHLSKPASNEWTQLNPCFGKARGAARDNAGASFAGGSSEPLVDWIGPLRHGLAVVVRGVGAFRLPDANPEEPQWLIAHSQGPPADAKVTCAAESGDTLYVGTEGSGVWAYAPFQDAKSRLAMIWQCALPGERIVKLAPLGGNPPRFAVLTSTAVVLLSRTDAGQWEEPRQISRAAVRDMVSSKDGLYWIEAADGAAAGQPGATSLCFSPPPYDDQSRVELVGDGVRSGAATYSVAVDPQTYDVLRADTIGKVARYERQSHRWCPETVGNKSKTGLDLFSLGGSVWAWSCSDRRLFRREAEGQWKRFTRAGTEAVVNRVAHDPMGMLMLLPGGAVSYAAANGDLRTIIPRTSEGPTAGWQDGALAELGDWLLVSDDRCLRAYHQKRHQWKEILPAPVRSFEPFFLSDGRKCFYAKDDTSGRIWCISEKGPELTAVPVAIPGTVAQPPVPDDEPTEEPDRVAAPVSGGPEEPGSSGTLLVVMLVVLAAAACSLMALAYFFPSRRRLLLLLGAVVALALSVVTAIWAFRPGGASVAGGDREAPHQGPQLMRWESGGETRLLAKAPDGTIYELRDGAVAGRPLVHPVVWPESQQPQITAATEWQGTLLLGYRTPDGNVGVAVYDPLRLAWKKISVPAEEVARFWSVDSSLLIEVRRQTDNQGQPAKALWEISHSDVQTWSLQQRVARLYDVAFDGTRLWYVNAQRRISSYPAGAESGSEATLGLDHLAGPLRAVVPIGDELVALREDGTIWHYSLSQLCWHRTLPNHAVTDLFLANGNLVALEVSADLKRRSYWHYAATSTGSEWLLLPVSAAGVMELPSTSRDVGGDRWRVTIAGEERRIDWREGPQSDFHGVAVVAHGGDVRCDFNRYSRIVWRNGVLLVETLASGSQGRVCRRFATGAKGIERELEPGKARFQVPEAAEDQAFRDDPSLDVDGQWFAVEAKADGPWPLFGKPGGLQVKLKQVGKAEFSVAPVRAGDGWSLDIDHWAEVTSFQGLLHAATRGGILSVEVGGKHGIVRRVAYRPCTGSISFARRDGRLFARVGDGAFFQFDGDTRSWLEVTDSELKRPLQRELTLVRCNRHLRSWRVSGSGPFTLQKRVGGSAEGASFVPVSLDKQGFGFDRVIGLELEPARIAFYGPDGRVCYYRTAAAGEPIEIDPQYRLPANGGRLTCYRAARHPKRGLLLLGDDSGWRFDGGTWRPLVREAFLAATSEVRQTLCARDGWKWRSDDSVVLSLPPFEATPLEARFDPQSGQFSFDRLFALRAQGDELLAASGAGVLTWRRHRLVKADGHANPGDAEPSTARFFRGEQNELLLHFGFSSGAGITEDRLFRCQTGWQDVEDPQEVRSILSPDAEDLLSGVHWSLVLRRVRSAAVPARSISQVEIRRRFGSGDWQPVKLSERRWTFEDVTCACWADGRIVCGTGAGLVDLRGQRLHESKHGVQRLEPEGNRMHVAFFGGQERWLRAADLAEDKYQGTPFAELDRCLLEDERWKWSKPADATSGLKPLRIEVCLIAGSGNRQVAHFGQGRFDFDRVEDVGCDGRDVVLATAAGLLVRPMGSDGSYSGRLPVGQPDSGHDSLFAIWWRNARRLYVNGRSGQVLENTGNWTPLSRTDARQVLRLRDQQVARNHRWNVTRGSAGPEFRISVGAYPDQPVELDPRRGMFSFDIVNDVLLAPDGQGLFVATEGGLPRYGLDGELKELRAGLQGSGKSAAVSELLRTAEGPIARCPNKTDYLWSGESWDKISGTDAARDIRASLRRVHHDPAGWQVERVSEDSQENTYQFVWRNQPLTFVPNSDGCFFQHDQARSAEWHAGCLWVATKGGVLRLSLQNGNLVAPAEGPHLWTKQFLGQTPFQVRKHAAGKENSVETIVCRTLSTTDEERRLAWLPSAGGSTTWKPVSADGSFEVLHTEKGLWKWRLPAPEVVKIVPNEQVFKLPASGDYDYFHGGQMAFWDVASGKTEPPGSPADGNAPDPLAFGDRLFLATAGGVVRLSDDLRRMERVYAVDEGGQPLLNVTALGIDVGSTDDLYARANGRVYRYRSDRDVWQPVPQPFPGRMQTVNCAWLTFRHPTAQSSRPRFTSGVSDVPRLPAEGRLLDGGRFLFDRVEDFVWREEGRAGGQGSYWLLTPMGIVQLDPSNGGIRHFAASFDAAVSRLTSLHLETAKDRQVLYVCDDTSGIWEEQAGGQWSLRRSGKPSYDNLRTVVGNELLTCRRMDDCYDFRLGSYARQPLVFQNKQQTPALIKDGVFLFDDLRDVRVANDRLVVAARDGVWEYDLNAIYSLVDPDHTPQAGAPAPRIPLSATFSASAGASQTDQSLTLTGLAGFAETAPEDPLCLFPENPRIEFIHRGQATWTSRPRVALPPAKQLDLPDQQEQDVVWRISLQLTRRGRQLSVHKLRAGRSSIRVDYDLPPPDKKTIRRDDVVHTKSSIWIALPNGLLWVRKSKFQEGWWGSRGHCVVSEASFGHDGSFSDATSGRRDGR